MSVAIEYLFAVFSCILFWMIHLETDPTLGKVWIRPDSNGTLRFRFKNLLPFFILPWKESWIWKPRYLDTNPYGMMLIGCSAFYGMSSWILPWIYNRL